MSNTLTLAAALFAACRATINAENKLTVKMREVYELIVSVGFVLTVDSKINGFKDTLELYAKSANPDTMELYSKMQDTLRLKLEGKTDEKRAEANAMLSKLDSQWRSVCRYEQQKLRDAQSKDGKDVAKTAKEQVAEAAKLVAALVAADPSTLSPEEQIAQGAVKEIFSVIDTLGETYILAIRQHTFDVLKNRKETVTEPIQEQENPAA